MLEEVEKFRQRQTRVMERFAQAQARIAGVEARLQSLYSLRGTSQSTPRQTEITSPVPTTGGFLPASSDLELQQNFASGQEEEQGTTELQTPLRYLSMPETSILPSSPAADRQGLPEQA